METTSYKQDFLDALNEYYQDYVIETVNGTFQVFQSFTYGELVISFLLALLCALFTFKWIWEVVR